MGFSWVRGFFFYQVLLRFRVSYWVFVGLYLVLPSFMGLYGIQWGFPGFNGVFVGFDLVVPSSRVSYLVS